MDDLIYLIILAILVVIGLPLAAIVVMVDTRKKMAGMQAQIDRIGVGLHKLDTAASTNTPNIETVETPLPKSPVEQEIDKSTREAANETTSETMRESEEITPAAAYASSAMAVSPTPDSVDRVPKPSEPEDVAARGKNPVDHFENLIRRATQAVTGYFTDGNLFVRIGILVLFFGVAFLLKYAAENSRIPLEFRFMGAAAGGLGLILFGWQLRRSRAIYALLLQGAGIGIVYITIFASFRLADLLPPTLTFVLLVLF